MSVVCSASIRPAATIYAAAYESAAYECQFY